ncbi:hypothetical protein [Mucilaginibacter rubeus]|uniref:Uncharacterized protein n=1 Tax=Mucilaginibacter rubeus TaxID=2027860 RepID=A0A5C1HWW3_9SPHI|nr:hypothetical protein [Mucilaginibacter rubeus]QEM10003.1 hypothetical protein DEO27_008200 [Mucilaginibacter rubeus]
METLHKKQTEISGIVGNYLANKHEDISAIELVIEDKALKFNFPPHAAKTIMEKVRPGSFVKVVYEEEKPKHDPKGDKKPKLKLLAITGTPGGDLIIEEIKPQKINGGPLAESLTFSSFELLKGKKGDLTGIKSGKQLVHIHKEDQALVEIITPGSTLEITAVKRTDGGFVNQNQDDVFHIQKLLADGQEYISKK